MKINFWKRMKKNLTKYVVKRKHHACMHFVLLEQILSTSKLETTEK